MYLNQHKGFYTRYFKLNEESLVYKQTGFLKKIEVEIPFEDIRINRFIKESKFEIFYLLVGGMFGFFFSVSFFSKLFDNESQADWLIIIIMGAGASFFTWLFFLTKRDEYLIMTEFGGLSIFSNKPSKQEVEKFLNELKNVSKTYVTNKYLNELDSEISRKDNLDFLYKNGFLSKSEFNIKVQNNTQQRV